jgi:SAM-dependent methyltransferase
MSDPIPQELSTIYRQRFSGQEKYRQAVWNVLTAWFEKNCLNGAQTVLDLGCGYGEFINTVKASTRYAMDLNPDAAARLDPAITFLQQDCSAEWQVPENSLDAVFTSNFFEHLPNKECLRKTLGEAWRCLRPGGRLIAMGPNINLLHGVYWDFYDHHVALTEKSLAEAMQTIGFGVLREDRAFLPYTMSEGFQPPVVFMQWYLSLPFAWRFFGKQFLVVGQKPLL